MKQSSYIQIKLKVKRTIGLKNLALNSFIGILNLGIC